MAESELKVFELLKIVDNLKHLKRTGWVPEPETVACHMYRMAVLAMALRNLIAGIDVDRVTRMALVHDIGEALVGDITPYCGVSDLDKFNAERIAVEKISEMAPGVDWFELWKEYEEARTLEAQVVKHLDKFDMVAQAFEYEQKHGTDLEQFFASTSGYFCLEPFVRWDAELRRRREEWKKSG